MIFAVASFDDVLFPFSSARLPFCISFWGLLSLIIAVLLHSFSGQLQFFPLKDCAW